jgi:hypothetical protein
MNLVHNKIFNQIEIIIKDVTGDERYGVGHQSLIRQ